MQLSCKSLNRIQREADVLIRVGKCQISVPEEEEILGTVLKTYMLALTLRLLPLCGYGEYKWVHPLSRALGYLPQ